MVVACALAVAAPARAASPVIAAAGDIACDPAESNFNSGVGTSSYCRQRYTSDLLVNAGLSAVLPLGDNQYYCGGYEAFLGSYDPTWGRVKAITFPALGNHEYLTSGGTGCTAANARAAGYFRYFGARAGDPSKGYYSYDLGSWHLIALNSQCSPVGGCQSASPQAQWLRADLAAHPNRCTLAYWHIPLFSSGGRANNNTRAFWDILYAAKADVILTAHDHIYERFAPQTPTGAPDQARGIREFVVGTGGADHTSLDVIAANSEVRDISTYGVLELTLDPGSYTWRFVPEAGSTFTDVGSQSCHTPAPPPTAAPPPVGSGTAAPPPASPAPALTEPAGAAPESEHKSGCGGLTGKKLAKCRSDQMFRKRLASCSSLKGATKRRKALCIRRSRAIHTCWPLKGKKKTVCVRNAKRIRRL